METVLAGLVAQVEPEVDLVTRMATGDEDALRALYSLFGRRLYAYAFRMTGSASVAEEVLQDSLLAAWKGARKYRRDGRVIAWLLAIVHRQALNATRRKRWPSASLEDAEDAGVLPHAARADVEGEIDRGRALSRAIGELSVEHRLVLELVFYQGLTMAETAKVCGCPVGTVKSRLSYAKLRLKGSLEDAGLSAEDLL